MEDAEEPVNINWENFDVSTTERVLRRLAMYLIVLLVMFISFLLLLYINAVSKSGSITCPSDIDYKDPTKEDILAAS